MLKTPISPRMLESDQEFFEFPAQHDHSVLIVLADWCGACRNFANTHLEGVKMKFMVEGIPLGIANFANLSTNLQRDKTHLPHFPACWYCRNGQFKELYKGDRSPNAFSDWVQTRMKEP
jgi:hypothetical protein